MHDLSIDDFTNWLNGRCDVASGDVHLPMTLQRAEALDGGFREAGAFRVEFLGPPRPIFDQAIMTVRRDGFDREIFLVPLGSDANGTRYEAVFY